MFVSDYSQCKRNHTIILVAFDHSEPNQVNPSTSFCNNSCGSVAFIDKMKEFTGKGKIKLAILMNCLFNFDTQSNSQSYAAPLSSYFKDYIEEQGFLSNKGNFIAVTSRQDEKKSVEILKQFFEASRTDDVFFFNEFVWEFSGQPSKLNITNSVEAFGQSDYLK